MIPKRPLRPFTSVLACPTAARFALLAGLALGMLPLGAAAQNPAPPPPGSPASGLAAPQHVGVAPVAQAENGGGPGSAAFANMAARMDNLQSEIDTLSGNIQVIDHQLQQLSDRIDKLTKDVDFRLNALEGHGPAPGANAAPGGNPGVTTPAAEPNGVPNTAPGRGQAPGANGAGENVGPLRSPPPHPLGQLPANTPLPQPGSGRTEEGGPSQPTAPQGASAVVLPHGPAEAQYKFATDFLRQGEYDKAGQAFEQFLKAHPKHPLASNAQYWLGETYYVRQLYAQSAAAFLAGYRKDPKGDKAPADLLKLGMSLIALKKPQEACAVFKQLEAQYPHAESRIKEYAARERARAKCS